MTKKHIHCDVIKAWADGAEIEFRHDDEGSWGPIETLSLIHGINTE